MIEKVKKIIAEHFNVAEDSLSENTVFVQDLRADSLDMVELIMTFEEEYDISIPDEVVLSVKTIGDVIAFLEKQA